MDAAEALGKRSGRPRPWRTVACVSESGALGQEVSEGPHVVAHERKSAGRVRDGPQLFELDLLALLVPAEHPEADGSQQEPGHRGSAACRRP